jgi:hypothetical protein
MPLKPMKPVSIMESKMDDSEDTKVDESGHVAPKSAIIFDWDDTLLASSFLSNRGCRLDTDMSGFSDMAPLLRELETSVISVLELALEYGQVFIITNAETGWVQLSCEKFIPRVLPLLGKINILSARSTYEPMYPEAPLKWKYYAFHERISSFYSDPKAPKNVLSFGDSHVEREAVRAVTKLLPNSKTKSVKFAERPSMEQLRRQIELVTNCFRYIHSHDGDLDLQLTVTVNSPQQPNSPQNSLPETEPTESAVPSSPTDNSTHSLSAFVPPVTTALA